MERAGSEPTHVPRVPPGARAVAESTQVGDSVGEPLGHRRGGR